MYINISNLGKRIINKVSGQQVVYEVTNVPNK